MRTLIGATCFLVAGALHAEPWEPIPHEPWRTQDSVMQGAVVVLQVIDWGQTANFVKHPSQCIARTGKPCEETNTLLGDHPSVGRVNNLNALAIVGHAAISYVLPQQLRPVWQSIFIGLEVDAVTGNKKVGVGFRFPLR